MKSIAILFLALFCITGFDTYAQKAPIKFGKVSKEELEMTTYELDSGAPAVVLCDYGKLDVTNLEFKRILRVKILKKEGLMYANRIYPGGESTFIRGKTFNLENGKVIEEKDRIVLIELFHKSNKEMEDRDRILNNFK